MSILIILQAAVDECFDVVEGERHDKTSKVHAIASSQFLIYANSFLEEWANLGVQCKENVRVIKIRKLASPFVRRVEKWNLTGFRNVFLAHNLRDKRKRNALIMSHDKEFNFPHGYGDFVLLRGCLAYIKDILVKEFVIEYNELIAYLKTIKVPSIRKGIGSSKEANLELDNLIAQSEMIRRRITYN